MTVNFYRDHGTNRHVAVLHLVVRVPAWLARWAWRRRSA